MLISNLIPFIFLGLGTSQKLIANGLDKANTVVDGLNRLVQLGISTEALESKGLAKKESLPLSPPRIDYGFTPEEIRYYIKHTGISRCSPSQIENNNCFCEGKFQEARVFINETFDAHSGIAIDELNSLVVIAYRDTLSEKNWDNNFRSSLINHPLISGSAKVHDGHLEYVNSLFPQMEPTVVNWLRKHPTYKLHITGYSLGGSASFISLPFWLNSIATNNLKNKVQLFSYASPRPGNVDFARHIESLRIPIMRYTQKGDVVPHVPDQSMGYSQVGMEYYDTSLPLITLPLIRKSIVPCSLDVIEDMECSLKDRRFHATLHLSPLQWPAPLPPVC
ncbi:hypothetical protein DSO57_1030085 [Entomophthora muscae]|uniref:Uncharacterized protein n=2 Tax=Entomophthora muscae TaxID=34485 RepID=A0ACC2TMX4_9FUNG|nr:hypothetical protein DSO57_1001261 [Entomophthora muscae]KAJ9076028.1 hypothetical protein DSO57_1030085 [Entomophthora muscae]